MTVPEPPFKLEGHCSVISGNTLYAYSPNGFASLQLKVNATWIPLNGGVSVSNPVCLKGGMDGSESDDEALYVVGGTTTSDDTYPGLQRFSFKDQIWQKLGSGVTSMTARTGHGAAFIASNSSIIVYAGNQGAGTSTALSAESFLVSTKSPWIPTSVNCQEAPTLNNPQLLPWNSTHVGMFGGTGGSQAVYTYSLSEGWITSPVSLQSVLSTSNPLTLLSGSGDSKVLEFFDMSASPNSVTNYELISSDGKPESPAVAVRSSKKRSTGSYPTYNDTLAPSYTWSDYGLAQGSNGMVVLSSGKSNNSLAIFNQTSNSWVNSTELFYGKTIQHALETNTTTSTTMTPTATATPSASTSASATPSSTTTAAAAASGGSHTDVKVIIGAVLGSVCGVGIILLLLLWLLKRERTKRERNGQARGGDSKDRLSFQDQGIEPLAGGAYPMAKSPVPVASMSADSLAIISGKYAGEKSLMPPPANAGYGLSATPRKSSPLSPIPSSGLAPSSMYSDDAYRNSTTPSELGNKPGDRTTDEGWGKYFEDNNTTNLAGMAADRSTTSSIYTKSDYRGSAWPMSNLTPLNLGFLDQPKPLGRVYSGSPTTEHASSSRSLAIPEGQSARISSADSISVTSDDDPHDTNWTGAHTSWLGRPASSNYSTSFYNSSSRDLPSSNPQLPRHSNGRRSSIAIPDDIDELPVPGRNNVNSDMSWLNIHADR